jgi:hypothetical protein
MSLLFRAASAVTWPTRPRCGPAHSAHESAEQGTLFPLPRRWFSSRFWPAGEQDQVRGNPIWALGRREAHQCSCSTPEWIDGGGRMTASRSGGHRCSCNGRRGAPWRRDAWGGVEGSEDGQRRPALARSSRQSEEQNGGECGAEAVVARCEGNKRGIALTPVRFYRHLRRWTPAAWRQKP